jgi:hypothetical protein
MPRIARVPVIGRLADKISHVAKLVGEIADELCGERPDFMVRSNSAMDVMSNALWIDEESRLKRSTVDAPFVMIGGEKYKRIKHKTSPRTTYHGLWGAHQIQEPLYRLTGLRNGPTIKPLACRVGVVSGSLLPNIAYAAGELMTRMTSVDAELVLSSLGFRPPSRSTLDKRVGELFSSMAITVRELESECRAHEQLEFELGAVSCGLDRFAVRMSEELADGPIRNEKLARRRPSKDYLRKPPEPYTTNWRMSWAANVTLYDTEGIARHTYRYGTDSTQDPWKLAARLVDDVVHLVGSRRDVPVVCIQDGASDLEPLRCELRERLPEGVPRRELVDYHHAISYLDSVVSALPEGTFDDAANWYRTQLLTRETGVDTILKNLRKQLASTSEDSEPKLTIALEAAISYLKKRRLQMNYASARREGLPIGSGATESSCALFQLRVKHPGSHWKPPGLRGTMSARGLMLSGRWERSFELHRATGLESVSWM